VAVAFVGALVEAGAVAGGDAIVVGAAEELGFAVAFDGGGMTE